MVRTTRYALRMCMYSQYCTLVCMYCSLYSLCTQRSVYCKLSNLCGWSLQQQHVPFRTLYFNCMPYMCTL